MKVCPSCNESFSDDLNFCDIDGTRLQRSRDVATTGDRSRAWSLLGAGLLISALVISALSIIFFPKSRVAPTVASSVPAANQALSQGAAAPSATAQAPQPEIVVEEAPAEAPAPAEVKKKEKPAPLTNANSNAPELNPKAVAMEDDPANSSKRPADTEVIAPVETKAPEPAPTTRAGAEPREPEMSGKSASAADAKDPKKDPKRQTKDSDKDNAKKKDNGKEKKKGGFFGVFKKIFGKD